MEISSIKNMVMSTQCILEESNKILTAKNNKYYNDVLDFINLLFADNASSLLNIQINKITLNETIFELYNQIILTYKLDKPLFDIDNFNLSEIENLPNIKNIFCDIACIIANNLLEKINYKLKKKINKENDKIKFTLVKL